MKGGDLRSLQDLMLLKARSLSEEATKSGGRIPAEQLEELAQLGRLIELARVAAPQRRPLWPAAVVFGGTILLVSLLAFGRTSRTEIVLDVEADEIGFRVPAKQIFLESVAVTDLAISGDTFVDVPEASGGFRHAEQIPVRVSVVPGNPAQGSVNLSAVTVPADTRVWIRYAGARRQFRISHEGTEASHRVSLSGLIDVTGPDEKSHRMDFRIPRPMRVRFGKRGVDLDLTLPEANATRVISNLEVSALELTRIDEAPAPAGTAIRHRSTVRTGTLYLESLNGRARELRPGELIRLNGIDGEIRIVELKTDAVALQFHGWVTGITTGSPENPSSLMPTWLEWLRERKALYLFWGTALYLFGLAAGVMRWLRIDLW